ncbi:MAG: MarR family transcriptional regulator [Robiginitomaculum sp.]|nr:MarR family transcriptional regulator [Robiginitomaculum sp.]
MKTNQIYDYTERLSEVLRVSTRRVGAKYGLQPVQIQVLRYLSLCNRFSDTPMGVTEYLGLTKGTVSQTLKVLEKKSYITKRADALDKRLAHLKLTRAGKGLLSDIMPPPSFKAACASLSDEQSAALGGGIEQLLLRFLQTNSMKTFGLCYTCRYNKKQDMGNYSCTLLNIDLSLDDTQLICREHVLIGKS